MLVGGAMLTIIIVGGDTLLLARGAMLAIVYYNSWQRHITIRIGK